MPSKQYKPACETCSHPGVIRDTTIGPHVIGRSARAILAATDNK